MNLENSRTLINLINSFTGESISHVKYNMYSQIAKSEGLEQISEIFYITSVNEYEHAMLFYKNIPNNHKFTINTEISFFLGSTIEILNSASIREHEEWETLYKNSAIIAKEEGFIEISHLFNMILEIEKYHCHRFDILLSNIKTDSLYQKNEQNQWICRKCGYINISKQAPLTCPVCFHPQGYFQLFTERF